MLSRKVWGEEEEAPRHIPEVVSHATLAFKVEGGANTPELALRNHCFAIWWRDKNYN